MHITTLDAVRPGKSITARPVFGTIGQPVIEPGVLLTGSLLDDLKRLGIDKIVVVDDETRDVSFNELIDSHIWIRLVTAMRKIYIEACMGKLANAELLEVAAQIGELTSRTTTALPSPARTVPAALQPFAHVVNVAIWAGQAGFQLEYSDDALHEIIVGCLLHDVGKLLTNNEGDHAAAGYEFARNFFPPESNIPLIILHHNHFAASGQRRHSAGRPYLEAARLCCLCSLFEHMSDVSDSLHPGALDILRMLPDHMFSVREVTALDNTVPKYLPGSTVRTSGGRTAVVLRLAENKPVLQLSGSRSIISWEDHESPKMEFVRM